MYIYTHIYIYICVYIYIIVYTEVKISTKSVPTLRQKGPNTEFFLARFFLYSD